MKLEEINQYIENILGSALQYNLQIEVIITSSDDEGELSPVKIKVLEGKYSNVIDGVKDLLIKNIEETVIYMLLDEFGNKIATEKEEKALEIELLISLAQTNVNSTYRGLFKKRIEFRHETLFSKKDFNFLPRDYKLTYYIIVMPVGKAIGGKSLLYYLSKIKYLIPRREQKLLAEKSEVGDPKKWIILPANNKAGNSSYPKLLVSTERSYSNKNWYECQSLLHNDKEFMLTIRQFIYFINLLRS